MEGLSLDNMMTGEEAAALFDPESNKEEIEETPSKNPDENKKEIRYDISCINDIYKYKDELINSLNKYEKVIIA